MNGTNEDAETAAKRARFESKFLRKRFSLRPGRLMVGKPNRYCERSDTDSTATTTSITQEKRESGEVKVVKDSDDEALERLAAEELVKEAAKAKARADVGGPSEWKIKPKRVNIRFMTNSILQTESQNRRKTTNRNSKKE